ncbi:TPA: fimbrial protein [Citrobacter amalonaticus]|uniref:fimbrial protein n=1 Tax=Citrobacter amalonaticus TaxID=35703 RepID=UPI00287AD1E3|nr:fimbrial protein [Citrobacter amalonaticus]MDS4038518.1 fimbrial protein [Citrobacter amalonaticus]HED3077527.1 fimbrial protein [Citrobacter amalonaticus]HED3670702.1 fimbrial protein [Citrobacter amalonaticus]HED3697550.1 fimbrial protein [Citrobacter amalonaticus]HEM8624104.1 fimbrial protein [Citrobacter amalonaticus]
MINRRCLFFPLLLGLLSASMSFSGYAAQKANVSLPIAMTVTNPQCQINNGAGLPENVQLPLITTSGALLGDNNVEVPILINCLSNMTKFEVTFTGGNNSKITISNTMVDLTLSWKKGGGVVTFGSPVELSKPPFLVNPNQFDGSLLVRVSPHTGTIPAGNYTASLPVTFTYY